MKEFLKVQYLKIICCYNELAGRTTKYPYVSVEKQIFENLLDQSEVLDLYSFNKMEVNGIWRETMDHQRKLIPSKKLGML